MAVHRFIGDREAPAPIVSMRRLRTKAGTGEIPAELAAMARARAVYVETDSNKKPQVDIDLVSGARQRLWKIQIPVGHELRGARPGLTLEQHPGLKFLEEVDEAVSFKSHRPDWIEASPVPRLRLPKAARLMRRFNGRRVEPLWVYDNARHAFEDSSWPWGLVGRIFNSDGASGTGTLIGDRLVVTAGHMVPWGSDSWWMRFVPAYFNGTSLYGAGVESYVSDVRGYNTTGAGFDWAILRLYEPLGRSLGYFGYNSYTDDWNDLPVWSNIGYPGDIDNAEEPAFQQGYTINDTDGDDNGGEELETENCDLNFGNSGGPMFAWWNNGTDPRVVGVVSAQETEYKFPFSTRNDNFFASGDGFVNLCAWGRSNWPA
jgi:V8-like Glu-specific endopeptidase